MALSDTPPHEDRAIKRLWAKGDMLGLKLKTRGAGAKAKMTLPLEPERVKSEWRSSGTVNPYRKATEFGRALGMADESFLAWFELAAPDDFSIWYEQAQAHEPGQQDSASIQTWLDIRRVKTSTKRRSAREHFDWPLFLRVFVEEGSPLTTAYKAASGSVHSIPPTFYLELEKRGVNYGAEPLGASAACWAKSVRGFIWVEGSDPHLTLSEVCERLQITDVTMIHRLARHQLKSYSDREDVRAIVREWAKGTTIPEIAAAHGLTADTVENRIAGYAPRPCDDYKVV
jgi:hypothetical protein